MTEFIVVAFDAAAALKEPAIVAVQQDNSILILGLAATIATVLTAIISAVVAIYVAKLNTKATAAAIADEIVAERVKEAAAKAAEAAVAVEAVKVSLEASRDSTDGKLDVIHTLVNSNLERVLGVAALALRQVADIRGHPGDIEAAEAAEAALSEHRKKQAVVDAGLARAAASRNTS